MGVYIYTLRKQTLKVGEFEIGRYACAYKPSGTLFPSKSYTMMVNRYEAAADKAFVANNQLQLAVFADNFNEAASGTGLKVYRPRRLVSSVYDNAMDNWEVVGRLVSTKNGKKKEYAFYKL